LDIDIVTDPDLAFRLVVSKASLPGTAARCTVEPPPLAEAAGAAEDDVLLAGAAAVELDAGALAVLLLLLELPHPATTSAAPVINKPIALRMVDLLIG
jgi:hypothetical protein